MKSFIHSILCFAVDFRMFFIIPTFLSLSIFIYLDNKYDSVSRFVGELTPVVFYPSYLNVRSDFDVKMVDNSFSEWIEPRTIAIALKNFLKQRDNQRDFFEGSLGIGLGDVSSRVELKSASVYFELDVFSGVFAEEDVSDFLEFVISSTDLEIKLKLEKIVDEAIKRVLVDIINCEKQIVGRTHLVEEISNLPNVSLLKAQSIVDGFEQVFLLGDSNRTICKKEGDLERLLVYERFLSQLAFGESQMYRVDVSTDQRVRERIGYVQILFYSLINGFLIGLLILGFRFGLKKI